MAVTTEDDQGGDDLGIRKSEAATDVLLTTDNSALPQDEPIPTIWLDEYDDFRPQDQPSKKSTQAAEAVDLLLATYWD